jgi:hypothetical protein
LADTFVVDMNILSQNVTNGTTEDQGTVPARSQVEDNAASRLYGTTAIARKLGVTARTIYRWRDMGVGFPVVKVPGIPPKYRLSDVNRWLDRHGLGGGRVDKRIK